jgi:hypothetical protein
MLNDSTSPIAALAGSISAVPLVALVDLVDLSWPSIALGVAIAGLAGLANAINKSISNQEYTYKYWFRDFIVGIVAGIVMFGFATANDWDANLKLSAMALSGWAGNIVLDKGPLVYARLFKPGGP